MPSILNEDFAWEWMFENPSADRITEIVTTQYPSELMGAWTIKKDFKDQVKRAASFVYHDIPMVENTF